MSFFKSAHAEDGVNVQFRVEIFNALKVRVYGAPNTNPSNATFGIVSTASQVNFPRTIQLGVRVAFRRWPHARREKLWITLQSWSKNL